MSFTEVISAEDYLSADWYEARRKTVSASEIAIVLGLSSWGSAFDLWWLKRTGESSQEENRQMRRGRRLESLIVEDFGEEHPEFYVSPAGLCVSVERPYQSATPDGLASECEHEALVAFGDEKPVARVRSAGELVASVEAKSAGSRDGWGEPGTDEIPVAYRCQALWQMDVLDVQTCFVPVWFGTDYREYVVGYDADDVALMRKAAQEFLDDVDSGRQPDVDSHVATARRLKWLHPSVVDDEVELEETVVNQYRLARRLEQAAADRKRLAENRIRAALGDCARGTVGGRKVASRSVYDVKARTQEVRAHTVNRLTITKEKKS